MKKLNALEKFVITPNVGFYGGFVYDGEDIFLCDDTEQEEGCCFRVVQKIENDDLITDIDRIYKMSNGKEVRETSHMEVEIEPGQLLVYVEGTGFTISEYKMCRIDEAIDRYKILKGDGEQ